MLGCPCVCSYQCVYWGCGCSLKVTGQGKREGRVLGKFLLLDIVYRIQNTLSIWFALQQYALQQFVPGFWVADWKMKATSLQRSPGWVRISLDHRSWYSCNLLRAHTALSENQAVHQSLWGCFRSPLTLQARLFCSVGFPFTSVLMFSKLHSYREYFRESLLMRSSLLKLWLKLVGVQKARTYICERKGELALKPED